MPALSLDFSKFKALQIPKDKAAIGTYALPGAMRFRIIPAMASPQRIPLDVYKRQILLSVCAFKGIGMVMLSDKAQITHVDIVIGASSLLDGVFHQGYSVDLKAV